MLKLALFSSSLTVGEYAPEFSLIDQSGRVRQLSDYKGKKLVIYFFPKAFTPGWTKQACGLRDNYESFKTNNISILGVSYDSQTKLKDFKEELHTNHQNELNELKDEVNQFAEKFEFIEELI